MKTALISALIITLSDPLNPECGYQMRIERDDGSTLLFTSVDPETGKDLLTLSDCLRVARGYETPAEVAA